VEETLFMKRIALLVSFVVAAVSIFGLGSARASNHLLDPFTQSELNNDWQADRQFPSDGVTSVTAFGRSDVARIGIDSSETTPGTFTRTEGIKTVGAANFGTAVQVDLYVDPDWETKAVRAGFWVVGDNGAGARDNLFGILEFVHLEPSTSGASAQGNHEGWRFWDSATGLWTNSLTPFEYGEWATLSITLDTTLQRYVYAIDGQQIGTATGGANFIRELFLNSYNYGLDTFENLSNESYAAHWHVGFNVPASTDDCKKGGWTGLTRPDGTPFKNQGDCVSFVASGK
jgi:hypothetical protein